MVPQLKDLKYKGFNTDFFDNIVDKFRLERDSGGSPPDAPIEAPFDRRGRGRLPRWTLFPMGLLAGFGVGHFDAAMLAPMWAWFPLIAVICIAVGYQIRKQRNT